MVRAVLLLAALTLVVSATPLCSQSPAERAGLEQLRDSLNTVTDSAALMRLEAATIEQAKRNRADPMLHLRLGFVALRLGELVGKSHFDDAAVEFEWAAELQPGWPYPWYGDGLAELALGEHEVIGIENLRQIMRKDHLSKATRAFARAAEADPSFAQATVDLARTALSQRIAPRVDLALRAVREAAASPAGREPEVQLARGRVERATGHIDSAVVAFQTYLAVGGDSGIGFLEAARTAYDARDPGAGRRFYFAGAEHSTTPAAVALYRDDLAWIASALERAAFDSLTSAPARMQWLRRFWERRDAEDVRDEGERLAEHYRRLLYAEQHFRLVSRHRHYDVSERFRSNQDEFDDRGIIYVRHGTPDQRATFVASDSVEPNETWLYRQDPPNEPLIFHFVARKGVQDYKMVESLADALAGGLGRAMALQGNAGMGYYAGALFASRRDLSPVYARLGDLVGSANARGALAAERTMGQRNITAGTTTDSYHRSFDTSLEIVTTRFVVGAREGDGEEAEGAALHVVFAIPAKHLTPQPDSGRVVYPLSFRLLVTDVQGTLVKQVDTTRVFASRQPLPGEAYLTGQLSAPISPGRYVYRLLVEEADGRAGDVTLGDSISVAPLSGREFAVSDLVVGRVGSGLVWNARGDTVFLNPLDQFPQRGAAELYYEVYGVARGTPYQTALRLERVGGKSPLGFVGRIFGGGSRAPVSLDFDAPSDGPVTRVHRRLDLRDVSRGTYVLSVRITDPATGTSLTRRQRFTVVSR